MHEKHQKDTTYKLVLVKQTQALFTYCMVYLVLADMDVFVTILYIIKALQLGISMYIETCQISPFKRYPCLFLKLM